MNLGSCPGLLKQKPHCFCDTQRCCFCKEYKWNLEAQALEKMLGEQQAALAFANIVEDDGSEENIDYASTT